MMLAQFMPVSKKLLPNARKIISSHSDARPTGITLKQAMANRMRGQLELL